MKILGFFLIPVMILSSEYYATVEPYTSVILKSGVSGLVTEVKLVHEGTVVEEDSIIKIDSKLDKINLKKQRQSLVFHKQMLSLNKKMIANLTEQVQRQKSSYKRMNALSTASVSQKDSAYSSFLNAKTQYISTKEKVINLKLKVLDLQYQIEQLKDSINKKRIVLTQQYLYKLLVRTGDFVAAGTALAQVEDSSKAKLILFLESEVLKGIKEKSIYIENEKTRYKINKIWRIADKKYISSYRVEIYIDTPQNRFSKLVKVEFK